MNPSRTRGYTLIELMVAIGLFAFVMTLTSGAYLMMISLNRRTQGLASGVDNLSFALESMTRSIRTGSSYSCGALGDCASGASTFTFADANGHAVTYTRSSQTGDSGSAVGDITVNGVALTAPSVNVTALTFYVSGSAASDALAPHVTITVSGTVSVGPGKTEPFTIETGATMRGVNI